MNTNKSLFCFLFCISSLIVFGQTNQINGFDIPRLSPRPSTVAGVEHAQISLNGEWNFQISGQKVQYAINVPGEWEMQGHTVNEGETTLYTKELIIPADWKGKRIKIRSGQTMNVWLSSIRPAIDTTLQKLPEQQYTFYE